MSDTKISAFQFSIGLNDKDTKVQKVATLEAYKVVENIISRHETGATITEGRGCWERIWENTLVMVIDGIDRAKALAICEDIKTALNQEAIRLEEIHSTVDYV